VANEGFKQVNDEEKSGDYLAIGEKVDADQDYVAEIMLR